MRDNTIEVCTTLRMLHFMYSLMNFSTPIFCDIYLHMKFLFPSEEKASKLHIQQVPPKDLLLCMAYFRLFLLPFLFFGLCRLLLLVSLDIDYVLFVLDLHMKYTVEVVPLCTYIVWFVIV